MHGPRAHVNFPNVSSSQATPGSLEFFGISNKSEDCVGEVVMMPLSNNVETPNVCSSQATPGSSEFFGTSNKVEDCVGEVGVKPVFNNNMEIPNVSSSEATPGSSEFFGASNKLEDHVEVVVKPVTNKAENEAAIHPDTLSWISLDDSTTSNKRSMQAFGQLEAHERGKEIVVTGGSTPQESSLPRQHLIIRESSQETSSPEKKTSDVQLEDRERDGGVVISKEPMPQEKALGFQGGSHVEESSLAASGAVPAPPKATSLSEEGGPPEDHSMCLQASLEKTPIQPSPRALRRKKKKLQRKTSGNLLISSDSASNGNLPSLEWGSNIHAFLKSFDTAKAYVQLVGQAAKHGVEFAIFKDSYVPSDSIPFLETAFAHTPDFVPTHRLSNHIRSCILSDLGLVLFELHHSSLSEINEANLLSWRDICRDAKALGCQVSTLSARIRSVACAVFKRKRALENRAKMNARFTELEKELAELRKQLSSPPPLGSAGEHLPGIENVESLGHLDDGLYARMDT